MSRWLLLDPVAFPREKEIELFSLDDEKVFNRAYVYLEYLYDGILFSKRTVKKIDHKGKEYSEHIEFSHDKVCAADYLNELLELSWIEVHGTWEACRNEALSEIQKNLRTEILMSIDEVTENDPRFLAKPAMDNESIKRFWTALYLMVNYDYERMNGMLKQIFDRIRQDENARGYTLQADPLKETLSLFNALKTALKDRIKYLNLGGFEKERDQHRRLNFAKHLKERCASDAHDRLRRFICQYAVKRWKLREEFLQTVFDVWKKIRQGYLYSIFESDESPTRSNRRRGSSFSLLSAYEKDEEKKRNSARESPQKAKTTAKGSPQRGGKHHAFAVDKGFFLNAYDSDEEKKVYKHSAFLYSPTSGMPYSSLVDDGFSLDAYDNAYTDTDERKTFRGQTFPSAAAAAASSSRLSPGRLDNTSGSGLGYIYKGRHSEKGLTIQNSSSVIRGPLSVHNGVTVLHNPPMMTSLRPPHDQSFSIFHSPRDISRPRTPPSSAFDDDD